MTTTNLPVARRADGSEPTRRHLFRRGAPLGDVGQATHEYVGMIIAAAVIIVLVGGALLASGPILAADAKAAICRALGGNCTTQSVLHTPTSACVITSHSVEGSAEVVIFSVDIGGDAKLTLTKEIGPDGKPQWYVQEEGSIRLGASFALGEEAAAGDVGEGVEGEIKALLTGGGGQKLRFSSEQDARNFMIAAEHEPIKQALTGWDPTGLTHRLADWIDGHHYDPPKPDEYFYEGGLMGTGSVEGTAGVTKGSLDASASAVVGYKVNTVENTHTVYLKVSADAAAKLGVLQVAQASGQLEGEVVVGITYDDKGRPLEASLEAAGGLTSGAGTIFDSTAGQPPAAPGTPRGASGGVDATSGVGSTGSLALSIDLTRGNNLNVVADGLHSLGVPVLLNSGTGGYVDPATGVLGIYALFSSGADGTTATLTTYDSSSSDYGLKFEGGEGVEFGLEGNLTIKDENLVSGQYYVPGQGFVPWLACYQ